MLALMPVLVAAVLISVWAIWRRHDPQVQAQWQSIALIVLRQVLLFVAIAVVLMEPRLLPVVVTGLLALFAAWWVRKR